VLLPFYTITNAINAAIKPNTIPIAIENLSIVRIIIYGSFVINVEEFI